MSSTKTASGLSGLHLKARALAELNDTLEGHEDKEEIGRIALLMVRAIPDETTGETVSSTTLIFAMILLAGITAEAAWGEETVAEFTKALAKASSKLAKATEKLGNP